MAVSEPKTPRASRTSPKMAGNAVGMSTDGKRAQKKARRKTNWDIVGQRIGVRILSFERGGKAQPDFLKVFRSTPAERVAFLKGGVPYEIADQVVSKSRVLDKQELLQALGLPRATYDRRIKDRKDFPVSEGEKIMGFGRLIGQVEAMLADNGATKGFDARSWLSNWLRTPLPPLGQKKPVDLLDTIEGQNLVSSMLDRMALGVYA